LRGIMPFVNEDHREKPDAAIPGDRCYLHYKKMLDSWRENPRWTTIDGLLADFIVDEEERAFFLAFLVFFALLKDSGERHQFASGMVRDTATNKTDYMTVIDGPMFDRWAEHLSKAKAKYPDVKPGVANWTLAAGEEEYRTFPKVGYFGISANGCAATGTRTTRRRCFSTLTGLSTCAEKGSSEKRLLHRL
jgi:hypothetical protein